MIPFVPDIVPDILQALVFTIAFVLALGTTLRKHPIPFYVVFIVASALTFPDLASINQVAYIIVNILASCYTGVAFYLLVMFTGALPPKWGFTKLLYSIRSQLSILAGFIIASHVIKVIFFVPMSFTGYWPLIWRSAYPIMFVASTVVGLPLLVCFLAPWITSFPGVRKRMDAGKWKRVQRLAYPFMALLVLQGILLAAGHAVYVGEGSERFTAYAATGITYAVIGLLYLALKLKKLADRRKAKQAIDTKRAEQGTAPQEAADQIGTPQMDAPQTKTPQLDDSSSNANTDGDGDASGAASSN